jgi:hypothetical protein
MAGYCRDHGAIAVMQGAKSDQITGYKREAAAVAARAAARAAVEAEAEAAGALRMLEQDDEDFKDAIGSTTDEAAEFDAADAWRKVDAISDVKRKRALEGIYNSLIEMINSSSDGLDVDKKERNQIAIDFFEAAMNLAENRETDGLEEALGKMHKISYGKNDNWLDSIRIHVMEIINDAFDAISTNLDIKFQAQAGFAAGVNAERQLKELKKIVNPSEVSRQ